MELSITFAPTVDESPLGYYRRLAADNALWSWKELARMAGVSPSRTGVLSQPDYLADSLGLQPEWTHALAQREATQRAWRGLHRHGHDAVCPICLAESIHLKAAWEHAYAVACHQHGVMLLDQCPSCGDFLSHDRERIELCRCGHDLRLSNVQRASSGQVWLAKLLDEGHTSVGHAPELSNVSNSDASQLARLLCQRIDPTDSGPRRNSASPRTVREAIEFLQPLESLLGNWPQTFEAHVAQRLGAARPDARTLNAALGRWYQQLKALASGGPCEVFLVHVIQVAAREFDGVIDHVTAAQLDEDTHMPVAAVAKTLGMGRDALVQHLKEGRADFRTRRLGTRGLCYEVPLDEVQRLQQERQKWTSIDEAGERMGVSRSVLQSLGEAGQVQLDVAWRTQLLKGGPVLGASLDTFEARLREHLRRKKTSESTIALRELTSRRVGDKRALLAVMRAMGSGELQAVAVGERVGSFRFLVSDIKRYFGRPVLEAGLSVNQLAKLTGWKWESIRHWIDQGLLGSHEIMLRGQPCKVVMPEQLLAFSHSYVPLATLAQALDSRSSALLERLGGIPLLGGKTLPNGAMRGALVCLSDLARAALLPSVREEASSKTTEEASVEMKSKGEVQCAS